MIKFYNTQYRRLLCPCLYGSLISHVSPDLDETTDNRRDLSSFISSASEPELDFTHPLHQEHLHGLIEVRLHHTLVQLAQNVLQGQRMCGFKLNEGVEGCFKVLRSQCLVDLLDTIR